MPSHELEIAGEILTLLPEHALWWKRVNILFVSDLHLGKAAAFRSLGIPIPHGTTNEDLEKLSGLVARLKVERIIILGDLLHSANGRTEKLSTDFSTWRIENPDVELTLVRGNHDRNAGDPPVHWNIQCVAEPYIILPYNVAHDFRDPPESFGIQGHIHPKVFVGKRGKHGRQFPCFVLESHRLIIPAFGSFTGGFEMEPQKGTNFYPVIDGTVYEMNMYGRL